MTDSNRINLLLGALAGMLLLALTIALTSMFMSRPALAQANPIAARQITVVGTGTSRARPDTAQVQIGVETTAPTTTAALEQNSAQVNAVVARLKELGIAETDIQTSNFNMYATYDENGREVTGYTVSNMVSVTIRNLAQAGTLLDEVVQVGANRIYGISFNVDQPDALMEQARNEAIADARVKAEQMAQVSGTTLGEVLVITENIGATPPIPFMGGAAAEKAAADVPVQGGEQVFNASIQVTFALQ